MLDKFNAHREHAFDEVLSPMEARRLFEKLEVHFTPAHGSWLSMAEIKFRELTSQFLDRRIPDVMTSLGWKSLRGNALALGRIPPLTGSSPPTICG